MYCYQKSAVNEDVVICYYGTVCSELAFYNDEIATALTYSIYLKIITTATIITAL